TVMDGLEARLAFLRAPNNSSSVERSGQQPAAVRAECDRTDVAVVLAAGNQRVRADPIEVPDAGRSVRAGGGQQLAVRTEDDLINLPIVPQVVGEGFAGRHVPDLSHAVAAGHGDARSVGTQTGV